MVPSPSLSPALDCAGKSGDKGGNRAICSLDDFHRELLVPVVFGGI
jgi:hypothetical protein